VFCIGEAPAGEKMNAHWFSKTFPVRVWPDHNPGNPSDRLGIVTVQSPAPKPGLYNDTSSGSRDHFLTPVYGPAYAGAKGKAGAAATGKTKAKAGVKAGGKAGAKVKPAPPPPGGTPIAPGVTPPATEDEGTKQGA